MRYIYKIAIHNPIHDPKFRNRNVCGVCRVNVHKTLGR
jgi:hypothetical protein